MKTLNVNSNIRIKLTPCGIAKLKAKHEELRSFCPSVGKFIPPKADKDGYCEMELWEVMSAFGEDMYPGNKNLPFEFDTLQIDDSLLKESVD